jgi:hypothetical protein
MGRLVEIIFFFFPSSNLLMAIEKKHRSGAQSAKRRAVYRSTRFDRIVFFRPRCLIRFERERENSIFGGFVTPFLGSLGFS